MTQATDTSEVLNRLDRLTTAVESIQSDIQGIKLSQARTEEKLDALNQRLGSLEDRVKSQDSRVWGILVAILGTALGLAAKLAFFPVDRL
jgi:predicted nuclease with TOPRIM domain